MQDPINSEELKNLLEKKPDATVLIDVRRNSDFEADNRLIPGAQRRDPEQVDIWRKTCHETKRLWSIVSMEGLSASLWPRN